MDYVNKTIGFHRSVCFAYVIPAFRGQEGSREALGGPGGPRLSSWRPQGVKKLEICKRNDRFSQECAFYPDNSNIGRFLGPPNLAFSIVFCKGPCKMAEKQKLKKQVKNRKSYCILQ